MRNRLTERDLSRIVKRVVNEEEDRKKSMKDISDDIYIDDNGKEFLDTCISENYEMKGQIIYFHSKEGKPLYIYKPLDINQPEHIKQWEENTIDEYTSNPELDMVFKN